MVFSKVDNFDLGKFLRGIFDEVPEHGFVVVSDHAYFLDVRYLCDGGETVPDDGMSCYFEERLKRFSNSVGCWNMLAPLVDPKTKV